MRNHLIVSTLALAALWGCNSSKPYVPSEVSVGWGYAWNDTVGAPSLDHEGPMVWATSTWVIASGRKTQEKIWSLDDKLGAMLRKQQEQTDQLQAANEMRKEELVTKGILQEVGPHEAPTVVVEGPDNWWSLLTDTSVGALGLPNGVWVGVVLLMLGVAVKYLGLGRFLGIKPKRKKGSKQKE